MSLFDTGFPGYIHPVIGITVACGEGRCDKCSGIRSAHDLSGAYRPVGACTHACHTPELFPTEG